MHQSHKYRVVGLLVFAAMAAAILAACTTETIVERTVIVEREVPGPVQTVIVEMAVRGDEVIVERTVIVEVEKEVLVDVIVDRTVIVTRAGDTVIVVATAVPEVETFFGLPLPVVPENVGTAPAPQSSSGSIVVRATA